VMENNYDYVICKYCGYTDYGFARVNTGPWNLCEGLGCEEARQAYEAETGEKWEGE